MTAVLRLLGFALLGLLLLLLLLLLCPVTVDLLYERGVLTVGVRVLGVRIPLLPKRSKKPRKKAAADTGDDANAAAADDLAAADADRPAAAFHAAAGPVLGENAAGEQGEIDAAEQSADIGKSGPAAGQPDFTQNEQPNGQDEPAQSEQAPPAHSEQPEPAAKQPAPTDTAGSLSRLFAQFQAAFDPAKRWVRWLFAHMRLREFVFVFNVRSADPAQLGVECGILWVLVGRILWFLGLLFGKRLQLREVTVYPCFHPQDGARERFGFHLTAAPIIIGIAAAGFFLQWQRSKKRNGFAKQGATIEDGN